MRLLRLLLFLAMPLILPATLFGQYYDQGQMPFSLKWRQIKSKDVRLIYPDYFKDKALTIMGYMDTVRRSVSYGMSYPPKRFPIILKTENAQSNGLVMWAPKRMELITMPDINTFAEPWLKQLATHEYRHVAQYSNLDRHFLKGLSYIIGQQAGFIGLALVPIWYIEGDAVMSETQMASFGRALQPSFTIDYRAYFTEGEFPRFQMDKWFCGSFKDYIPDHYHIGYQLVNHSYNIYGKDVWNDVMRFTSKYPYALFTTNIALKKYYGGSVKKLYNSTFAFLRDFWRSQPLPAMSGEKIETRTTSFTTYSYPVAVDDTTVVALKKDMDVPYRLVGVDPRTGREKRLAYTGVVNSQMVRCGNELLWTEYRPSLFWAQRTFSAVCSYDLVTGKERRLTGKEIALYPLRMPGGDLAYVSYDYRGFYNVKIGEAVHPLPDTISVHGLAYDELTRKMVVIGLSDEGMWFGEVNVSTGGIKRLNAPSRITVSNLRARDGKLYYGSIQSGRDEVHSFDLTTGEEVRITTSPYGAFGGSVSGDSTLYYTNYSRQGYMLARQKIVADSLHRVEPAVLPLNVINPPIRKWDGVVNIDSVKIEPSEVKHERPRRFNNGLRLFNIHSWAPLDFDPNNIFDQDDMRYRVGFTLISQSLLSNMMSHLSYGWTHEGGSRVSGQFQYYGFAPKIEVGFRYGGGYSSVMGGPADVPVPPHKRYFSLNARVFLPFNLSGGYWQSQLTPLVEISHNNHRMYDPGSGEYSSGYQRLLSRLQFAANVRMSERDFLPRWGVLARVTNVNSPFTPRTSNLWSLLGRVYTPGILPHHSITLRAAVHTQTRAYYSFTYKDLTPRGTSANFAARRYLALSGDYQFTAWCPDFGINSILFFRRIRINMGYDFARYQSSVRNISGKYTNLTSYGGDIYFDLSPLRTPDRTVTVGINISKPSDKRGVVVGFDLNIPL